MHCFMFIIHIIQLICNIILNQIISMAQYTFNIVIYISTIQLSDAFLEYYVIYVSHVTVISNSILRPCTLKSVNSNCGGRRL